MGYYAHLVVMRVNWTISIEIHIHHALHMIGIQQMFSHPLRFQFGLFLFLCLWKADHKFPGEKKSALNKIIFPLIFKKIAKLEEGQGEDAQILKG